MEKKLKAILDYYLENHVDKNVIGKDQQRIAIRHLNEFFGKMTLEKITAGEVYNFILKRSSGSIGRPATAGGIRRELAALVAAMNFCGREKIISKDDIPHIPMPPRPPARSRWLSTAEAGSLLKTAKQEDWRIYLFCVIALNTAARKTSILTLTWSQVDFDRALIYQNPPGRAQTRKRRSIVPMNDDILAVLQAEKEKAKNGLVLGDSTDVRKVFDRICRLAGLEGVTPHTLRHTWATWAAQSGVSMFDIAGVLGDTVDTVQKTYAHHSPDYLRTAVKANGLR